jgi:hypothetical protein
MINQLNLNSFYDSLNNELQMINSTLKTEKDEKKIKILISQSNAINLILIKLTLVNSNNEKLKL